MVISYSGSYRWKKNFHITRFCMDVIPAPAFAGVNSGGDPVILPKISSLMFTNVCFNNRGRILGPRLREDDNGE